MFVTGNSGFPKSLNVSKAIDERLGVEPIDLGRAKIHGDGKPQHSTSEAARIATGGRCQSGVTVHANATAPGSLEAEAWDGWGTALKPSFEPIVVARKPLGMTVAECVLQHGTGALNIGACRVGSEGGTKRGDTSDNYTTAGGWNTGHAVHAVHAVHAGRWPANVLFSHVGGPDGCQATGEREDAFRVNTGFGDELQRPGSGWGTKKPTTTTTTTTTYRCVPGCPVAELDAQSGAGKSRKGKPRASAEPGEGYGMTATGAEYDDAGGASRFFTTFGAADQDPIELAAPFFYCAKPSTRERDEGLDHLPRRTGGEATDRVDGSAGLNSPRAGAGRRGGRANTHSTVKPVAIMRWLCRLVTPAGGICLDPFAGSGTTGVAAIREGFQFIGFELGGDSGEHVPICEGRLRHALRDTEKKGTE